MKLFKNQGDRIGTWEISITDNAELKIEHARFEGAKVTTRLIPVTGKNIGRSNETTPLEQAELEMASRIKKQMDKGYVTTREEAEAPATNSMGFTKPQLAMVYSKVKGIDWASAFAQRKLDGHRCMYKDGQLYSRGGKPIDLPHVLASIEASGLSHLHLDGELYTHGLSLQEIGSLVKRPREESEVLEYHVYDVVSDEPFATRFLMETQLSLPEGSLKVVETTQVASDEELRVLDAKWVAEGYEGSILRWGVAGYQSDKRTKFLAKLKEYTDSEAVVVGWKWGTPRNNGEEEHQVVVFEMENNWGENNFEVTAPGNMQEVHEQAVNADEYVGKTLRFKYFSLSDEQVPLQPIALGWREEV